MNNSKTIDRVIQKLEEDIKHYQQKADQYATAPEYVHRYLVYGAKVSYAKDILSLVKVSLESEEV